MPVRDYVQINNQIDEEIKAEKLKSHSIHKKIFIFEVNTTILIIAIGAGLEYNHIGVEHDQKIGIEILLF